MTQKSSIFWGALISNAQNRAQIELDYLLKAGANLDVENDAKTMPEKW